MDFSYLAPVVVEPTLELGEAIHIPRDAEIRHRVPNSPQSYQAAFAGAERQRPPTTTHLFGRYSGEHKEIFEPYYSAQQNARAAHVEFLDVRPDRAEEIAAFTSRVGALGAMPWPADVDGFDFAIDLDDWREAHRLFVELQRCLVGRRQPKKFASLFDAASRYGALGFGPGGPMLTVEIIGCNPPTISFRVASLWNAMLLMLAMDLTDGLTIRRCANLNCRRNFTTSRGNKKYCGSQCALNVARNRWWRRTGAKRRRAERRSRKEHTKSA